MAKRPKKKKKEKNKTQKKKNHSSIKKNFQNEEELLIKVSKLWSNKAYANKNSYQKKYNHSIKKNDDFWKKEGKRITWIKSYKKIKDVKYSKTNVTIRWFYDGKLNASSNCIDSHLKKYVNITEFSYPMYVRFLLKTVFIFICAGEL